MGARRGGKAARALEKMEVLFMKRSTVNALLREAEELFRQYNISLPPFGSWSPQEWADRGREYDEIRDNMLGWDVTDYGLDVYKRQQTALLRAERASSTAPSTWSTASAPWP